MKVFICIALLALVASTFAASIGSNTDAVVDALNQNNEKLINNGNSLISDLLDQAAAVTLPSVESVSQAASQLLDEAGNTLNQLVEDANAQLAKNQASLKDTVDNTDLSLQVKDGSLNVNGKVPLNNVNLLDLLG